MSAPPLPVPVGGDVDRGASLIAIYWAQTSVALTFVCMRVWARHLIRGFGIDDWAMLLTMALFLILSIIVTLIGVAGGDRHLYYIVQDPLNAEYILKLSFISQFFAIMAVGTGKASVAFLLLRIINKHGSRWRKATLWANIVSTMIITILCAIFTFYQCQNPAALWNPQVASTTVCWNPASQADFSIFSSSWNVFEDFFLALLPVSIVWGLQLDTQKRIGLCVLLGLGIFAGVCAAIKTSYLVTLSSRGDPTWATYELYTWACTEIFLTITCGSIPAMKPLYDCYVAKKPAYGAGYGGRSGYGGPANDPTNTFEAKGYVAGSSNYPSRRDYTMQKEGGNTAIRMDTIITSERLQGKISGEDGRQAEARVWSDTDPIVGGPRCASNV